jgi:hypothetical protein
MKLLKLIVFIFIIYFIRRFFRLYKALKHAQEAQAQALKEAQVKAERDNLQKKKNSDAIDADFKIVDPKGP